MKKRIDQLKRPAKEKTPLDGISVLGNFYCAICKIYYKEWVDQGYLRRMPSHFKTPTGKKVETRINDGNATIMKAHKKCADLYLNSLRKKQGRDKKIIVGV